MKKPSLAGLLPFFAIATLHAHAASGPSQLICSYTVSSNHSSQTKTLKLEARERLSATVREETISRRERKDGDFLFDIKLPEYSDDAGLGYIEMAGFESRVSESGDWSLQDLSRSKGLIMKNDIEGFRHRFYFSRPSRDASNPDGAEQVYVDVACSIKGAK